MRLSLISISLQKAEQLWPVRTNVLVCLENLIEFVGLDSFSPCITTIEPVLCNVLLLTSLYFYLPSHTQAVPPLLAITNAHFFSALHLQVAQVQERPEGLPSFYVIISISNHVFQIHVDQRILIPSLQSSSAEAKYALDIAEMYKTCFMWCYL